MGEGHGTKNVRRRAEARRRTRRIEMWTLFVCAVTLLVLVVSMKSALSGDPAVQTGLSPQVTPTPTPRPAPVTLTVSVVGDCTLGTDPYFSYEGSLPQYYDEYGSGYFLKNVRPIFAADDLTIANFEGVLTDYNVPDPKEFNFKAPAPYAAILTEGDVETVNLANNHSHDYGDTGFRDTREALDGAGIVHFGYDETAVVDVKGVKVGLVGIYELRDHLQRTAQLEENIRRVRAEGAQLVIAIFHWGNERETVPDVNQTTLGRMAIDLGADLVCGHHPHVLQGIERYKGRYIVYSLGNFCFGGNSNPPDKDTMIFQQTFTVVGDEVERDDAIRVIPCSLSSVSDYNDYQPTPAQGDEAARILGKIEERSAAILTAEEDGDPFAAGRVKS